MKKILIMRYMLSLMLLVVSSHAIMIVDLNKSQETLVKESIALIENLYNIDKKQSGKFIFNKEGKYFFTSELLKRLRNTKNDEKVFYPDNMIHRIHPLIISNDKDNFSTRLSRKVRAIFDTKTVSYYLELDLKEETWIIYHIELPNGISYY